MRRIQQGRISIRRSGGGRGCRSGLVGGGEGEEEGGVEFESTFG